MNKWAFIKPDKIPHSTEIDNDFWNYFDHGDKILDVGCGTGRDMLNCIFHGLNVVGIDINKEAIEEIKENPHLSGVEVYAKSILDLDLSGFNGALLQGLLSTINKDDRIECLEKVKNALLPGGIIHIAEFERDISLNERYKKDEEITGEWGTVVIRDSESGKELCRAHNFLEEELKELLKDFEILSIRKKPFISYHGNKKTGIMIIAKKI
jgi:SAM-dependent methyltransferase